MEYTRATASGATEQCHGLSPRAGSRWTGHGSWQCSQEPPDAVQTDVLTAHVALEPVTSLAQEASDFGADGPSFHP